MAIVTIGTAWNFGKIIQPGLLFVGLQPIVSTCMAMTKADVRKHTLNVVRLSYISTHLSSTASYIRMSLLSGVSYIMAIVTVGTAWNFGKIIQPGLLFVGLQPIVSTCMAMTKADVRKHTLNVVRLSYISTHLSSTASYIRMSLLSGVSYIRTALTSRVE